MPASAGFNTATICSTLKCLRFIARLLSHRKVRRKLAYIMALFTGAAHRDYRIRKDCQTMCSGRACLIVMQCVAPPSEQKVSQRESSNHPE
jgi:hypothetical protein